VHDVVAVEQVNPPGDEVTTYEVISLAPLETGAVHATRTEESPKVPSTEVGGAGTLATDIGVDGEEVDPFPATLVAVTVNEYATPLVRPVIVQVRLLVVQVNVPGLEATAYELTAAPPSLAGALHDTMSDPGPYAALTLSGVPGVVAGVTAPLAADADPVPAAFVAATVKV